MASDSECKGKRQVMETTPSQRIDPRKLLSEWANAEDEWIRYIVRQVLSGAGPLGADEAAMAYALFRQEKAFTPRSLPAEKPLTALDLGLPASCRHVSHITLHA